MDPVSRLTKALAALRKPVAAPTERKGSNPAAAAGAAAGARKRKNDPDLRADIAQRIAQIDLTQPDQRAAAVRVFIEQVLSHEFGHAAVASAAFQRRIGDVQRVMDGDAQTRSELDGLLKDLLKRRDSAAP
jgi:hypothetical protein